MDLSQHYQALIEGIGEDITREGLQKTPERAAKAFQTLTRGYHQSLDDILNGAIFESDNRDMVIVRNVEFYSLCEHHLLPFFGTVQIGYIPNGKVIGLSKVARIIDCFARRLQIQENLTVQIANALEKYTNALGVAVVIDAKHLCMIMRGVERAQSVMTTSCMTGVFRDVSVTRNEFLNLTQQRAI